MINAFEYIKQNNGIDTEDSYPYQGEDKDCRFKAENVGATDVVSEGDLSLRRMNGRTTCLRIGKKSRSLSRSVGFVRLGLRLYQGQQ